MALPFRTLKKSNSLQSYIRKQNTSVADIFRNGFFENAAPSVALNSPSDSATTTDTTPTLDFTGTDAEGNDIRFELQLCDENDFYPVAPEILSSSQNSASSGSPNVSAPSGVQAGDKVIVVVTQNGQTTIADNNGSTPFTEDLADYQPNSGNGHTISVFSRIIQAGDPTTYNFTPGVTGRWAAIAIRLKGGEYDVAPSSGNAANEDDSDDGSIDAPSINVGNNSIHIVVCTWDTSAIGTITTPSGYTLIQNANGGGNPLHASSKAFATGGATGAVTCDNTEFGAMIAFSFSVKSRTSLLLDKVSGTDSGFANPDNGGDTDPFNAGENIQYTVQAGDALPVGTYYWRVRGIDPSGSNQWGAWSATRSFEVTSGGSGGTATPGVATMTLSALAATVIGGASIVAAVLTATFSIPPPTPSGGASIAPAVQSAVFSIQAPTVVGGANTTPSVAEVTFSVQAPTLSGGGVATPSVVEASFSAPTASASGGSSGNAEATPSVATSNFTVQNPAVSGGATIAGSVLELTLNPQNPVPSGGGVIATSVLTATFSTQAPTPSGAGVALPGIAEVMMSVPGGIATGGSTVSPIVLVATFEAQVPVASGVIIAYPDTAVLTLSALAPVSVIGGATAYPQPAVIGAYKLIYLIESDRYALRITGNMYLEL